MKIVCIGGGPGSLYFSILMKKARPGAKITVHERNRADDTFGFGVVFSDSTMGNFADADAETHAAILKKFVHWDAYTINHKGEEFTSVGHGFAGLSRLALLHILQRRARDLGVELCFESEVTDLAPFAGADLIVAADGANSFVREDYAEHFQPGLDWRRSKFIWLGTTRPFDSLTFFFKRDPGGHGVWSVHAYQYVAGMATFLVEVNEDAWRRCGMETASEAASVEFLEGLFAEELGGHRLLSNRSLWRTFATIRTARWRHQNILLLGDAAHTAHFSVGSGTKLAMEDSIALVRAIEAHSSIDAALDAYESERRPVVERRQERAQYSMEWYENVDHIFHALEPSQFAFHMLTRGRRVTRETLAEVDPALVRAHDSWFARQAARRCGLDVPSTQPTPATPASPRSAPLRLGRLTLANRIVTAVEPGEVVRAAEAGAGLVFCRALGDGDRQALADCGGRFGLQVDAERVSAEAIADLATDADVLALDFGGLGDAGRLIDGLAEHLALVTAMRAAWADGKALFVCLPSRGWEVPGIDGALDVAAALAARGCDLIEIGPADGAAVKTGHDAPLDPQRLAECMRLRGGGATGFTARTLAEADTAIASGRADVCRVALPDLRR